MLADVDAVSRSLIAGGQLEPVVDAWWVGEPTAEAERALGALDLGEVVTRARVTDDLARGPFEIIVPTVLTTLVVAAVVLLLAGIALVTGADQRRRAAELTRLRALGLPRPRRPAAAAGRARDLPGASAAPRLRRRRRPPRGCSHR